MKIYFVLIMLLCLLPLCRAQNSDTPADNLTVHHFSMTDIDGIEKPLNEFEGEVLLIVNVASKCGYTPQYAGLQKLYEQYRDRGFRVLAFPANNFAGQEPGSAQEIKEFCTTKYNVTFDLFAKISVQGDEIHPLYRWLTTKSTFKGDIEWNFTKFLIDPDGYVAARFSTKTEPLDKNITQKIEELLER